MGSVERLIECPEPGPSSSFQLAIQVWKGDELRVEREILPHSIAHEGDMYVHVDHLTGNVPGYPSFLT